MQQKCRVNINKYRSIEIWFKSDDQMMQLLIILFVGPI